jgi:hypothetical protein
MRGRDGQGQEDVRLPEDERQQLRGKSRFRPDALQSKG